MLFRSCVELKGEAFFEVKPDAQRPFYVKIDNYEVKVLGTSFNVKAYDDDDSWATTLCIGKVEMTDVHTRESIELLPGRQAVCDRHPVQSPAGAGASGQPDCTSRRTSTVAC